MKDVSIIDVFCEILGGLLVILFVLPWLAADPSTSFVGFYRSLYVGLDANALAAGLVASYLVGLLMDALGLIADEVITPRLGVAEATAAERKTFHKTALEPLLKYRDTQWSYYSLYRNCFIVVALGTVSTLIFWWHSWATWKIVVFLAIAVVAELIFWHAMKTLYGLYNDITRSTS
ncbi:hypothetical protein FRZ61_04870 [Hypericibacter adhaerens]|uniref:Uncharacterized protein n=1 Tax=Hypericibacter adhaerens TaxID=2602016 RepID=A0A5J6MWK6_9PROT|nr:hypothetical protein [Hypericibacter adhaerens]QEX20570.1 hypothetical protein FRZ61_04870 [Hypericibacter adhaerens]